MGVFRTETRPGGLAWMSEEGMKMKSKKEVGARNHAAF